MYKRKEQANPQYVKERSSSASRASVIAGLLIYGVVIGIKLIGDTL
jgi:hypothetical protein